MLLKTSTLLLSTLLCLVNALAKSTASNDSPGPDKKPFDKSDLRYGPAYAVDIKHPWPKNFDDTPFIVNDVPAGLHRELWKVSCYHLQDYFIGLQEYYKIPGSEAPGSATQTKYRGWLPIISDRAVEKSYELNPKINEQWDFISYKYCKRKLVGIHFGTTKQGGGVACGDYNYNRSGKGCGGGVLRPPARRRMIGLYGDANGVQFTSAQGVRGIGMITIAS